MIFKVVEEVAKVLANVARLFFWAIFEEIFAKNDNFTKFVIHSIITIEPCMPGAGGGSHKVPLVVGNLPQEAVHS
ncbi:MAG TPA: hypothetical protein VK133_04415, partial [Amoebophilaceae bacterium]|nr:hypothetical protein [Amoebophilaceae bacterium]